MNKTLYLIFSLHCISLVAAEDIDPKKYRGGVLGYFLYQSSKNVLKTVTIAPDLAVKVGENIVTGAISKLPDASNEVNNLAFGAGANLLAGALEQLSAEKRQEIGADLAAGFIDKMSTKQGQDAAFKLGEALIQGAAVGAAGVAASAGKAVAAKATATVVAAKASTIAAAGAAKTATIAGATVAAPYAAVGVGIVGVGYGGYRLHRMLAEPTEVYHRCLNDNLDCADLNARGFPKRCDSPERKAWNYLGAKTVREGHFQTVREQLQAARTK